MIMMNHLQKEHLKYFEQQLADRKIRPTLFLPLWDLLGTALGFGTAVLGKKAAMLCTASVEEVIDKHYLEQIDYLSKNEKKEKDLLAKVKKNQLQPHFVPLFDYVGMCGVFAGLSVAEPIFDSARPGLLIPSSLVVSCLRLFIGLGVLVSAWFAVRAVEKTMATSTWMRLALRFFRYAQVPPIILLVVPPCFEMCGI
jgi:hypothetical protein